MTQENRTLAPILGTAISPVHGAMGPLPDGTGLRDEWVARSQSVCVDLYFRKVTGRLVEWGEDSKEGRLLMCLFWVGRA
jgi:hypothetical protein